MRKKGIRKNRHSSSSSFLPPFFKKPTPQRKITRFLIIFLIFFFGFILWSTNSLNFHLRPRLKNDPGTLRIFAPSIVEKGKEVEFTVECWDYVERLSCGYGGIVEFDCFREDPGSNGTLIKADADFTNEEYTFVPSWSSQGLIEAYMFPWGDGGLKKLTVKFNKPGIHYIVVEDKTLNIKAYSNPIVVFEKEPDLFLYWGDIHGHSSKCDGSGDLDTVFYYTKNVACLDFASVTTHDHFVNALIAPLGWQASWEHTKSIVNNWNDKDDFVTLQAHEWRGNFLKNSDPQGDIVIYSRTSELPFFSGADNRYANEKLLNDALKSWKNEKNGRDVMTIRHHPPHSLMGMRSDLSYIDSEFTRLIEIYSIHGSSEMSEEQGNKYPLLGGNKAPTVMEVDEPGYHIRDALAMGYHLGFMASGDSHDGHIGHSLSHTEARDLWQPPLSWSSYGNHMFRCNHWQQNGLIGVFAPKLSRGEVFDAMWDKACYGIKGTSRPFINFTINGTMIGVSESIIKVPDVNSSRFIQLDVAAGGGDDNYLEKIEIIRNNEVWKKISFKGKQQRVCHLSILDNDTIEGLSYWDYADINPEKEPYKRGNKYYITEEADNGVKDKEEYSTDGEMFYYVKVYTDGSNYYKNMYKYYTFSGNDLVPRGDDVAWVGPIWINPN